MSRIWFFYAVLVLSMLFIIVSQVNEERTVPHMVPILIGFEGERTLDVITDNGGTVRFSYSIINAAAAYVPERAIDDISNDSRVKYVEMDETLSFAAAPQGKGRPPRPPKPPKDEQIPWGVARIGADMA